MKKRIVRWKFWKKGPCSLSLKDNFPLMVSPPREITLHEPVSGAIGLTSLLASIFSSIAGTSVTLAGGAAAMGAAAATYGTASIVGGFIVTMSISAGLSMASQSLASKPKGSTALNSNGMSINEGRARYDFYRKPIAS
jgi:hypothetical protein